MKTVEMDRHAMLDRARNHSTPWDIVIIGGGVAEALGNSWITRVRDVARAQVLVDPDAKIRIEPAALGDDAGIHGAALLARERFVQA